MALKFLLPLLAGSVLLSGTAVADSFPAATACDVYGRDLKQDLMLSSPYTPGYDEAAAALEEGRRLCIQGEAEAGVKVLQAGIASLGLPVRSYY